MSCNGTAANGGSLDTASIGAKSFTVTVSDEYGKTASLTRSYQVAYAFVGFDAPVIETGSLDGVKDGDAIPLKFSLGGDRGLSVVTRTTWLAASCLDWSSIGASSSGQGKLSYHPSLDRYLDLVATDPSWKGSCRTVDLAFADGTDHAVRVHFTQ